MLRSHLGKRSVNVRQHVGEVHGREVSYVSLCVLSYGLSGLRAIVFVSSVCSDGAQIGKEGDAGEEVHGGKGD